MRVITKDGFVKPDSIQVLIDLVRENIKSLQALESQMAGVPQEERWNIMAGNAIKFFRRLEHKSDRKESKV
jgi:hypothetical protein